MCVLTEWVEAVSRLILLALSYQWAMDKKVNKTDTEGLKRWKAIEMSAVHVDECIVHMTPYKGKPGTL